MTETEHELWVVDRVEADRAILVEDATDEGTTVIEIDRSQLGPLAVEGAVLRVPLGAVGEPVWEQATRDAEAEARRRTEAEARLDELRKRDPGGDIVL